MKTKCPHYANQKDKDMLFPRLLHQYKFIEPERSRLVQKIIE